MFLLTVVQSPDRRATTGHAYYACARLRGCHGIQGHQRGSGGGPARGVRAGGGPGRWTPGRCVSPLSARGCPTRMSWPGHWRAASGGAVFGADSTHSQGAPLCPSGQGEERMFPRPFPFQHPFLLVHKVSLWCHFWPAKVCPPGSIAAPVYRSVHCTYEQALVPVDPVW